MTNQSTVKTGQSWCSAIIWSVICNERGAFELQFHLCHCTDHCSVASQKGAWRGIEGGEKKGRGISPAPMPACSDACYAGEEFGNRSKDFFIEFYILENDRLFVWPLSQGQVIENFKASILRLQCANSDNWDSLLLFRGIVSVNEFYFYVNSGNI